MKQRLGATTRTETFSDVALASPGTRRTIAIHHRDGDEPVLAIVVLRDHVPAGSRYVHRRDVAPLERAIVLTRTRLKEAVLETGRITMRGGASVAFGARRLQNGEHAVLIWTVRPDGQTIGRPSTVMGSELAALERAVVALKAMSATMTNEGDHET